MMTTSLPTRFHEEEDDDDENDDDDDDDDKNDADVDRSELLNERPSKRKSKVENVRAKEVISPKRFCSAIFHCKN